MAINNKNYAKYKELMNIYETDYTPDKIKEDYPKETKKANIRIALSIVLPIIAMLGGMVTLANLLTAKAFFLTTGALVVGLNIIGTVSVVNALEYKNNIPIHVFKKKNPRLKPYSKETLNKKLVKYETEKKLKEKEYEEEKKRHIHPKDIELDFKLASHKISTEEKIAILEKEKAFWETVLLEEQQQNKQLKLGEKTN